MGPHSWLSWFITIITIVYDKLWLYLDGVINQLITGGPHPVWNQPFHGDNIAILWEIPQFQKATKFSVGQNALSCVLLPAGGNVNYLQHVAGKLTSLWKWKQPMICVSCSRGFCVQNQAENCSKHILTIPSHKLQFAVLNQDIVLLIIWMSISNLFW